MDQARKRHINTNVLIRLRLGRPPLCPWDKPSLSQGQTQVVPGTNRGFLLILHSLLVNEVITFVLSSLCAAVFAFVSLSLSLSPSFTLFLSFSLSLSLSMSLSLSLSLYILHSLVPSPSPSLSLSLSFIHSFPLLLSLSLSLALSLSLSFSHSFSLLHSLSFSLSLSEIICFCRPAVWLLSVSQRHFIQGAGGCEARSLCAAVLGLQDWCCLPRRSCTS